MSEIKIKEKEALEHYKALTDAGDNLDEQNEIDRDSCSTVTVKNSSINAFNNSVKLEKQLEEVIIYDTLMFKNICQSLFEVDDDSKEIIEDLRKVYNR